MTQRITSIDDLTKQIGNELRVGPWHELTQAEVDNFSRLSGEDHWIHTDSDEARNSRFGGPIAQGTLLLSMAPALLRGGVGTEVDLGAKFGLNYGFNKVRFISPVAVGQKIRARLKLVNVHEVAPNVYQIVWQRTIEIDGEAKPAMVAEAISQQYL